MARTQEQIEADLTSVLEARQRLLSGKSVKSLTVGSNDMQRRYSYHGITIGALNLEKQRLEAELNDLLGAGQADEFRDTRYSNICLRNV